MKTRPVILCMILILATIVSCKKNSTQTANPIAGNWSFISEHFQTQSTAQDTSGAIVYKAITKSDFTTTDIAGAVAITNSTMNFLGLAYNVSINAETYYYQNGQFVDSTLSPLNALLPQNNSLISYTQIGTDSIYFPSGSFAQPVQYQSPSSPGGARINITGDSLLTITSVFSKDSSSSLFGVPTTIHYQETQTATLQRQ